MHIDASVCGMGYLIFDVEGSKAIHIDTVGIGNNFFVEEGLNAVKNLDFIEEVEYNGTS